MRETTVTKSGSEPPLGGFAGAETVATIGIEMAISERVMPLMTVTETAATKIKELMSEETDVSVLRVAIQGGGCSGFQYGLGFDRGPAEGDLEFEMHGVQVVVDPFSAPYLQGAEVDYVDTIQSSGFAINNPNAVSSCGCGHSFQVEEGDTDANMGGCGSGCSA
jgi:iron-sulfur cluster assembly accessory protein